MRYSAPEVCQGAKKSKVAGLVPIIEKENQAGARRICAGIELAAVQSGNKWGMTGSV